MVAARYSGIPEDHADPGNPTPLGAIRAEVCWSWLRALRWRSQRSHMV